MTLFNSLADLSQRGFGGFLPVAALTASRCREVPAESGVYVVIRATTDPPAFLRTSRGGWFKGKDPTVAGAILRERWLTETCVLYLGKATSLRTRVRALVDYGAGKPVGHQGGRYLWQLDGCQELLIGWRVTADPRAVEQSLLADFELHHGQLPFANLSH